MLGHGIVRSQYRLLRAIARLRRRVFGANLPHWAKDGLALVKFVGVVDLLPTFIVMALVPAHFYKRLPGYLRNKRSWIKTPIKFLSSCAAPFAVWFLVSDEATSAADGVGERTMIRIVVASCLLVPLWIVPLCLAVRLVLAGVPNARLDPWTKMRLMLAASPSTYIRLDYGHFATGLFYFGIYACCAMLAWLVIAEAAAAILALVVAASGKDPSSLAAGALTMPLAGLLALALYGLLVVPYVHLLQAALRIPTRRMHRADCVHLRQAIAAMRAMLVDEPAKRVAACVGELTREIAALEARVARQDRAVRSMAERDRTQLRRDRARVYPRMLDTVKFRRDLASGEVEPVLCATLAPLIERIDAVRAG